MWWLGWVFGWRAWGSRAALGWVASAVVVCVSACSGGAAEQPVEGVAAEPVEEDAGRGPVELSLTAADIGGHLVDTPFRAALPGLLAEQVDEEVSDLPERARRAWGATAESGAVFSPSESSGTGETFWMHLLNDESAASAMAWVVYLGSLSAGETLSFLSPGHDLLSAEWRLPPEVGSASAAATLLHGHEGGVWRSDLVVFSFGAAVVFLRSSMEVGGDTGRVAESPPLTRIDDVARLIGERLTAGTLSR